MADVKWEHDGYPPDGKAHPIDAMHYNGVEHVRASYGGGEFRTMAQWLRIMGKQTSLADGTYEQAYAVLSDLLGAPDG